MAKSSALGAVFLIGLLVVAGLVAVSAIQSGLLSSFSSSITQGIADFFKSLGGSLGLNTTSATPTPSGGSPTPTPSSTPASGNAAAVAWFAFTLHFSDGTSQDLNMNPTFSIFPLSISYNGKDLASLDVFIRLKVTGSNLGAWNTAASQHIEVYFNGASTPATSSTGSFSDSDVSWTSGTTISIIDTALTSAQLDSVFNANGGVGSWTFQVTGTVSLSITSNGVLQNLSANLGQNDITLVESGFSVSSVTGTHLTITNLSPK